MKRHSSSPRTLVWGVLLFSTTLLVGCVRTEVPDPLSVRSKFGSVVRLTVQNNDFKDAVIYANWEGSTRRRVGLATGKTSQTFTFEWGGPVVRFEADFIAGDRIFIEAIEVLEGDHLDLVLMNQG